jgi:hypothetical protein
MARMKKTRAPKAVDENQDARLVVYIRPALKAKLREIAHQRALDNGGTFVSVGTVVREILEAAPDPTARKGKRKPNGEGGIRTLGGETIPTHA